MSDSVDVEKAEEAGVDSRVNDARVESDLSLSDVEQVDIRLRNLNVRIEAFDSLLDRLKQLLKQLPKGRNGVEKTTKQILSHVGGDFPAGSLSAIIGGSGSGKTTALNVLAERMSGGIFKATGEKSFNGNPRLASVRSAYVMQQDVLLPTLTVRETLRYAADLRLPDLKKRKDRWQVVEKVILELGLKDCANTRIGTSVKRGCSGGEKRSAIVRFIRRKGS